MNARNKAIAELVDKIAAVLKPAGCIGMRTSYFVTDKGVSRRTMVPERLGIPGVYAMLSEIPGLRAKAIATLSRAISIAPDAARTVLELAHELSELNDVGAWAFAPDTRTRVVADAGGVGEFMYDDLPGFHSAFHRIQELLPHTVRIEVSRNTAKLPKQKKTAQKGWFHFYDEHGTQVCAIAINMLSLMLCTWFGGEDGEQRGDADAFLGRWAHQCGVPLYSFMEAAQRLLDFDKYMSVTEIVLRTGEVGVADGAPS